MIVEAALHGVPSIGVDRGGISEAIGDAGIVLPSTAGPETWASAIREADHEVLGMRARRQAVTFTRPCLPELRELGI